MDISMFKHATALQALKKPALQTLLAGVSVTALSASGNALVAGPPLGDQLEEIVVSGAFEGRKLGETILGATILKQDDILRQLDASIGETLRRQPGITSTFFGPGASRPIIRGLGGDRIRVLDNGIGSIDASATSPDHAVAVEPVLAERIEILRGTAMLMYGSSAAGGVINVLDSRIPTTVPEDGFEGAVRYGFTSVNDGHEVTGAFNTEIGQSGDTKILLHGDYLFRDTNDYAIPGFAESARLRALEEAEEEEHEDEDDDHDHEEEEEEAFGILENSATRTTSGSGGLSFIFSDGFLGMNVRVLDSLYGVPGGHHHHEEGEEHEDEDHDEDEDDHDHEEEEEEEDIRIDLKQTRYDIRGELNRDFLMFSKTKLRFAYSDYEHIELEGEEIGTVFSNEGFEGRLDFVDQGGENWGGSTGIQFRSRDFSAIGAEAFVPPTESSQLGVFTVKEYFTGPWRFEVGGRYEHTSYEDVVNNVERSFDGFSASAGAGVDVSDSAFFGVTVFRTERAPSTEELFSNGPHLATNAFEVGDVDLGLETALGIEATFNFASGPFSFTANGYFTSYDDFIYEVATGAEEDELPVFEFRANDAQIFGFEAKAELHAGSFEFGKVGEVDVHFDGQFDVIEADLDRGGNDNLPRLPPARGLIGLDLRNTSFDFRTEFEIAGSQTDVSIDELATSGYEQWNAYLTMRPFDNKNISLDLRATNITNSTARQHTSFLKDIAPLPGRNIRVAVRAAF